MMIEVVSGHIWATKSGAMQFDRNEGDERYMLSLRSHR